MKFFYPDYEITVDAETQKEADKKLKEILNPKPEKQYEDTPKD